MGKAILVLGASKAGKTTSIRTLDPTKTIVFSPLSKGLPFDGSMKSYKNWNKDTCPTGNIVRTSSSRTIVQWLRHISEKMPQITVCIIDDNTFVMAKELDRRRDEKSYEKFGDIAHDFLELAETANSLRENLNVYVLHHVVEAGDNIISAKTIKASSYGKMIDEKLHGIESQFEIVFLAQKLVDADNNINYKFKTRDANSTCGVPMGMYDEEYIDNDLQAIDTRIRCYYSGDCKEKIEPEIMPKKNK